MVAMAAEETLAVLLDVVARHLHMEEIRTTETVLEAVHHSAAMVVDLLRGDPLLRHRREVAEDAV